MTRVAALDCGTNSLRLLVADVDGEQVRDVHRETRVVRLGEGVDRDRRLRPEAIERARIALRDYAETMARLEVAAVRLVATSAVRDAADGEQFAATVHAELGVWPDVLDGRAEAGLALAGARCGLAGRVRDLLVIDVGGGSTELIRAAGDDVAAHSMDVGAVRLTERHLRSSPPTAGALAAARADIAAALVAAGRDVPLTADVPVVGVAATVLTVVALARDLGLTDAVHGATVTAEQVSLVTRRLLAATRAQLAALPAVLPGREDVIAAGALVLDCVLTELGAEQITASTRDLLDGVALSLA